MLAFFEVYAKRWGLSSFFPEAGELGEAAFPALLRELIKGKPEAVLLQPDFAPPLWAAAALFQLPLEVRNCPSLRSGESDCALLLVEAALALGGSGEVFREGFRVDFSRISVRTEIFLNTGNDPRIAMAAGLVALDHPLVKPDRLDCLRKSFPRFWQVLAALEEAQPG
jgi:5-enolpyruvylshikimate-3-phosphate synthase